MSGVKRTTDNPITPRTTKKPYVLASPEVIVKESTETVRVLDEILNDCDWTDPDEIRMKVLKVKEHNAKMVGTVGMTTRRTDLITSIALNVSALLPDDSSRVSNAMPITYATNANEPDSTSSIRCCVWEIRTRRAKL